MIAFFFFKKDIIKLNFLQCLDAIARKILSPKIWIYEIFSKLIFINLGTQFGCPKWYTGIEKHPDTTLKGGPSKSLNKKRTHFSQ